MKSWGVIWDMSMVAVSYPRQTPVVALRKHARSTYRVVQCGESEDANQALSDAWASEFLHQAESSHHREERLERH